MQPSATIPGLGTLILNNDLVSESDQDKMIVFVLELEAPLVHTIHFETARYTDGRFWSGEQSAEGTLHHLSNEEQLLLPPWMREIVSRLCNLAKAESAGYNYENADEIIETPLLTIELEWPRKPLPSEIKNEQKWTDFVAKRITAWVRELRPKA